MCFKIKELILLNKGETTESREEDEENTNMDVIVLVEESDETGRVNNVKFLASFFTYRNIAEMTRQHQISGDFLQGTYFHAGNMVLIDRCSPIMIRKVVEHMVREGEFEMVFKRLGK